MTNIIINQYNKYVNLLSEFTDEQRRNINTIFHKDVTNTKCSKEHLVLILFLEKLLEEKVFIFSQDKNLYNKILSKT